MKRSRKPFKFGNKITDQETNKRLIQRTGSSIAYNRNRKRTNNLEESSAMFRMDLPLNIAISSGNRHCMQKKMDRTSSNLPNIPVKPQRKEYSLNKADAYGTSSSSDENDEKSSKSIPDPKPKPKVPLINADELRPYDVLCGRDKATFNNIGNRRFRYSIGMNIPRYEAAKTKAEKASVIKYVCDLFRDEVGVRFLKKDKNEEGYIELNGSEARKKVGHALRDMSVARQQLQEKRARERRSIVNQGKRPPIPKIDNDATYDANLLEPLPIDEQQHQQTQDEKFQPHYDRKRSNPFHSNTNWTGTLSTGHDKGQRNDVQQDFLSTQQQNLQQKQQHEDDQHVQQQIKLQQNDLQQTLLRLQQQQLQLQQERQLLLQQQERQQQLQEQQHQLRLQRQLQQLHQQQRQQQQQHQQNQQQNQFFLEDDDSRHTNDVFDVFPFQKRRRRR